MRHRRDGRQRFAAETQRMLENAEKKLQSKRLDLIVANDVTAPGAGFDTDTNIVTFITRAGQESLPLMSKRQVADELLNRILMLKAR